MYWCTYSGFYGDWTNAANVPAWWGEPAGVRKLRPRHREGISGRQRTLQGRPLISRKAFFLCSHARKRREGTSARAERSGRPAQAPHLTVPACWGYVREAPASVLSKCTSWCSPSSAMSTQERLGLARMLQLRRRRFAAAAEHPKRSSCSSRPFDRAGLTRGHTLCRCPLIARQQFLGRSGCHHAFAGRSARLQ